AGDELLDRCIGIEPDFDRVRADERAAEDAARQARDVVAVERFERANRYLGGVRNLAQRHALSLARFAELGAKTAGRPICSHSERYATALMLGTASHGVK